MTIVTGFGNTGRSGHFQGERQLAEVLDQHDVGVTGLGVIVEN
jgi:hypothetical protein